MIQCFFLGQHQLVQCRFTYTDALDKLGGAYKQATQLTLQYAPCPIRLKSQLLFKRSLHISDGSALALHEVITCCSLVSL